MFLRKIPTALYFLILSIGSALIGFIGMALQYYLQLNPCPYCIFQRILYFEIAFFSFWMFAFGAFAKVWKTLGVLAGLSSLSGLGLAIYQSVMQLYPGLLPECGFSEPNAIERFVDFLGMRYPEWFLATGFCSSVEWSMFGLSMANWSALCFLSIAIYLGILLRKR